MSMLIVEVGAEGTRSIHRCFPAWVPRKVGLAHCTLATVAIVLCLNGRSEAGPLSFRCVFLPSLARSERNLIPFFHFRSRPPSALSFNPLPRTIPSKEPSPSLGPMVQPLSRQCCYRSFLKKSLLSFFLTLCSFAKARHWIGSSRQPKQSRPALLGGTKVVSSRYYSSGRESGTRHRYVPCHFLLS